jgi:hypothetical protein
MASKLKFRARGSALVRNIALHEAGIRAYVGRKYVEVTPGQFGFAPVDEDVEVDARPEYIKACADGDLYPADEATAAIVAPYARAHGLPAVKFDPTFGTAADRPKKG